MLLAFQVRRRWLSAPRTPTRALHFHAVGRLLVSRNFDTALVLSTRLGVSVDCGNVAHFSFAVRPFNVRFQVPSLYGVVVWDALFGQAAPILSTTRLLRRNPLPAMPKLS